jgi:hypothetical protein
MKKLWVLSMAAGLALALGSGIASPAHEAAAKGDKPCARTKFKTKLVEEACKAGGQKAAKRAMKKFVKAVKKADGGDPDLACDSCHKDLAPDYPLAKDALKLFKKYEKLAK